MKQLRLLMCSTVLILAFTAKAQIKSILFIGNSYTYYNNMPEILRQVALSAGDTFYIESHTPGGARFKTHAENPQIYNLIRSRAWDYVVLQGQSQEPSWPDNQVASEVFPYVKQLCDSIKKNFYCTEIMFYMTWGRKNGDAYNCASWPPVCSYEGMDSILYVNYIDMGKTNRAEVSPVGAVWRYLRTNYPSIELYNADESHPSAEGSFAAALTFYAAISRGNLSKVTYQGPYPTATKNAILEAIDSVLLADLEEFNIGVNATTGFTTDIKDKCTVYFDGPSGENDYYWDFGDGNYSNTEDPMHIYKHSGTYTVSLTTIAWCGREAKASQTFTCETAGIIDVEVAKILVYPSPSKGVFVIRNGYKLASVFNELGQEISFKIIGSGLYSVDYKIGGVFFIKMLDDDGNAFQQKILLE